MRQAVERGIETQNQPVEEFRYHCLAAGVTLAWIVKEGEHLVASHPQVLGDLLEWIRASDHFQEHEAIFIGIPQDVPTIFVAVVHDFTRGMPQGGTRLAPYATLGDVFADGMRLAEGMTFKQALADLWSGGGKAIIPITEAMRQDPRWLVRHGANRVRLFHEYGRFVASLGGCYITAEDVGNYTEDMDAILHECRHVTCISSRRGGSGNPSRFTARGTLLAIRAAVEVKLGRTDLAGVRVAVQGAGNVGEPLIELLREEGAIVFVADHWDCMPDVARRFDERGGVTRVGVGEIYDQRAEVFAPCALGGCVNEDTIPRLQVDIVAGAANNILREPVRDSARLQERGILYVPDFVANVGGIANCHDEARGHLVEEVERVIERVYGTTLHVLKLAERFEVTPLTVAQILAAQAAKQSNPLDPGRGRRLLAQFVARASVVAGGA